MRVNGWLSVAQIALMSSAPFVAPFVHRRYAVHRERRLRAGRTVRLDCRVQVDEGELRRGKAVARGLGASLLFVPRRGKQWEVPAHGTFAGTREEPHMRWWDNPYVGAVSVFYRTPGGQTVRFRLPCTDAPVLETALAAARPGPKSFEARWTEPPSEPVRVLRWWLLVLAGALLLGFGSVCAVWADGNSRQVTVEVLSTDGEGHCFVSWLDPRTSERQEGPLSCPGDGWEGGPLRTGDMAWADVTGPPWSGELYGPDMAGNTAFTVAE
jgi:hypothetical protein